MTFVITDPCIDTMDQACVSVCPVDCIHFEEGKDRMLYINPAECIDCGACQPACPVSAIFPEGDVPADQARFIELNSLWYDDPDSVRTQVSGGGGGAPAAAPAAAAEPAALAADGAAEAPAAETPAAAEPAAGAAAPAPAAPAVAAAATGGASMVSERVLQVPATVGARAPEVSQYRLPSPLSLGVLVLIGLTVYAMFVFPGPTIATMTWAEGIFAALGIDNGGGVGITVMALAPLLPILLIVFIALQWRTISDFAARHPRAAGTWRVRTNEWRRNEESRRYNLVETVERIARDRFAFPDEANPDLKTYVNLPDPTMGIEVRGSGDKMFPDIVVLAHPGLNPIAIAQVESRETVTRDQATFVWARLDNQDCPLYVYVPAGLLRTAQDYARAAGIENVKFRTWRWTPNGMLVREA